MSLNGAGSHGSATQPCCSRRPAESASSSTHGSPGTRRPGALPDPGDVDVMLLSHGHSDHTADVIRLAKEKKPRPPSSA